MKKAFFILILILSIKVTAQAPIASVKFELHGEHIIIPVSVDGSDPLSFIFDSGDGLSVLDIEVAKKLGLSLDHKQTSTSAQGTVTGALIKHKKIEIEGKIIEGNVKIYATSLDHLEISIGREIDGIIGYDLMMNHGVRIDYTSMIFSVYGKGQAPKIGESLTIKMVNNIPTTSASVTTNDGTTYTSDFYLNTGAGTTLDFNTPFATANNIVDKTGKHYSYLIKGLGDTESVHYEGRVTQFNLGSKSFTNMPIGISQSSAGLQGDKKAAGIIGNKLLKKFNITFDLTGSKIYIDPNNLYQDEIMVNCSGLDLQLNKEKSAILIHKVIEGSESEKLGLKVNDIVVMVNGKKAIDLGLVEVEKLLHKKGEKIVLKVSTSAGNEKEVSLNLTPLL